MRKLLKNPKVIIVLIALLAASFFIVFNGLQFGIDFKGGTLFTVELSEPITDPVQLNTVRTIIENRMDAFGLKDTSVSTAGNQFILGSIAETDPEKIIEIENLIKTQGTFEAMINGNTLFTGSDIITISKDSRKGYGFIEEENLVSWRLPFTLKESAAKNFSRLTFHKCAAVSFDAQKGNQYDCEHTYFFIDRPKKTITLIPEDVYSNDSILLLNGNRSEDIPAGTEIDGLLENLQPYFIVSNELTEEQKTELTAIAKENKFVLVHPAVSDSVRAFAESLGLEVVERTASIESTEENPIPWVWSATGAQSVIALTASITNQEPYVDNIESAKIFTDLFITGSADGYEDAKFNLDRLTILLETGSLPVPIKSISRETISPSLGSEFLTYSMIMGLIALIVVALVIYIRYRKIYLTLPIILTGSCEVLLVLGFAAMIRWNLDLASVTGILASVGTGVDDQLVITDELMRKEKDMELSFIQRLKSAFFIVIASAATTISTMSPIILFNLGMGSIVGFAVTTIAGVLIGVLITRPAYGELAKRILEKEGN
ncbi:MAG: hypothetical protein JW703_05375 [Candidatus Diapherotrites archaeon]|nr:hypothetical protein [Candidatus Diapherotrites archaeon]